MARTRRSGEEAPMTLFSFQDIITCVTGILILVTLLMALDLTDRRAAAASGSASGPVSVAELSEIKRRAAGLRSELNALDGAVMAGGGAGVDVSEARAEEAERAVREWGRVRDALAVDVAVAESDLRERRRAASEAAGREAERERAVERELRERAERARAEAAANDRAAGEERSAAPESPLFVVRGERGGRSPLLAELDGASVAVSEVGADGRTRELGRFPGEEGGAAFKDWAERRDRSREYFVLLVRPAGVRAHEALSDWCRSNGFSVGTELLPDRPASTPGGGRGGRGTR